MVDVQPAQAQSHARRRQYALFAFCVLLVPAAFYLFLEHRAHLFGVLPYLLFALCPLMHLFMHRTHAHDPRDSATHAETHDHTSRG